MINRVRKKIREFLARRWDVPEIPFALERLSKAGFRPSLIYDVGAYRGDFAKTCLKQWPSANIVCIEPLESKIALLRQLEKKYQNIKVFNLLLGSHDAERVKLFEAETASSVLVEHIPQNFPFSEHKMTSIDNLITTFFNGKIPDFIKIDTQGYELEILKGSERSMAKVQVILAELNLIDIHIGVPLISEVFQWMAEREWVLYDICGLHRRPLDRALWQIDVIFVKKNSPLRTDKRWQEK